MRGMEIERNQDQLSIAFPYIGDCACPAIEEGIIEFDTETSQSGSVQSLVAHFIGLHMDAEVNLDPIPGTLHPKPETRNLLPEPKKLNPTPNPSTFNAGGLLKRLSRGCFKAPSPLLSPPRALLSTLESPSSPPHSRVPPER